MVVAIAIDSEFHSLIASWVKRYFYLLRIP